MTSHQNRTSMRYAVMFVTKNENYGPPIRFDELERARKCAKRPAPCDVRFEIYEDGRCIEWGSYARAAAGSPQTTYTAGVDRVAAGQWRPTWTNDATGECQRYPYIKTTRKAALALAQMFAEQCARNDRYNSERKAS